MKKWLFGTLVGGTASLLGAGAVVGITVPIIMKYKAGIDQFIPSGNRKFANLAKQAAHGQIKYVALGDSESAGYNGLMGKDYLSFADFFASDLQKANALSIGGYSNYAVSGAKIADTHQLINRNPSVMNSLQSADIITITIGANDLLSYAKLCDAQFGTSLDTILGFTGNPSSPWRNKDFPDHNPGDPTSMNGRWESLNTTMIQASRMFKENDFAGLVSMEPKLLDVIYQAIERDLLFLLRDLGVVAPHADIIVAAHAFPFINMPDSFVNGKIKANNNTTIHSNYDRYISSLKKAVDMTPYAQFVDFNKDIPSYDNNTEPQPNATDASGKTITDNNDPQFRYRKMPNITGIHPSTYGHQLLGNGLFALESSTLGIQNYKDFYTMSTKATGAQDDTSSSSDAHDLGSQFQRYDEGIYAKTYVDRFASKILKDNKTRNIFSELFNSITTKPNINTPTEIANSSFSISKDPKSSKNFISKANGAIKPTTSLMTQVTDGLFDTNKLGVMSMLDNVDSLKLVSSIGINMASAVEEGSAKPSGDTQTDAISPLNFIQKQMTAFKQTKKLTSTQEASFATAVNDELSNTTKSGGQGFNISYNSPIIDGKDISSIIPNIKTFGEAVAKYKETYSYYTIRDESTMVTIMGHKIIQNYLSTPLSLNNGQYFLNTLKQMGETQLLTTFTPLINKQITSASNNTALLSQVTTQDKQLITLINQLNLSVNKLNGTNPDSAATNIWNEVASHSPSTVANYINGLITNISKNKAIWNTFESNANIQGKALTDVTKTLSGLITEFNDVESFSQANIQSSIKDTVLAQTMANSTNKQQDNPAVKLMDDMISMIGTIFL